MHDVCADDKLRASIETLAAKFSEIERNKRRIQVIDLPPPPPKRATARPPAQKRRGKIVHETFEIDGIEVKRKTFVPASKKTSNLERLIKKAVKCGDVTKL